MTGQAILVAAADRREETLRSGLVSSSTPTISGCTACAARLCGSVEDSQDLVQETFLRAARSPASVPAGAPHEEAWLVRVLINIARDRWRRQAVHRRTLPQQMASGVAHVESRDVRSSPTPRSGGRSRRWRRDAEPSW